MQITSPSPISSLLFSLFSVSRLVSFDVSHPCLESFTTSMWSVIKIKKTQSLLNKDAPKAHSPSMKIKQRKRKRQQRVICTVSALFVQMKSKYELCSQ